MLAQRIKSIPVVDAERRILGIVSRGDLLRGHTRTDSDVAADVRSRLSECPATGDVVVDVHYAVVTLAGPTGSRPRGSRSWCRLRSGRRTGARTRSASRGRGTTELSPDGPDHRGVRVLPLEECLEHLRHTRWDAWRSSTTADPSCSRSTMGWTG